MVTRYCFNLRWKSPLLLSSIRIWSACEETMKVALDEARLEGG